MAKPKQRSLASHTVSTLSSHGAAMSRYAGGDDAAFGELYAAVAPRLLSYYLARTRDRARAEDLVHETFLHIHRGRQTFMQGEEVFPWAFTIARRVLIDDLRRKQRESAGTDLKIVELVSDEPLADDLAAAKTLLERLRRRLACLPARQREAFLLTAQDGLNPREAARLLGVSLAAVKLRAFRARKALREVVDA